MSDQMRQIETEQIARTVREREQRKAAIEKRLKQIEQELGAVGGAKHNIEANESDLFGTVTGSSWDHLGDLSAKERRLRTERTWLQMGRAPDEYENELREFMGLPPLPPSIIERLKRWWYGVGWPEGES